MNISSDEPIEYPIDGTLDLHQFRPKDVPDVVRDYIAECLKREIFSLRIVHGKGIGVQREIVRSILDKHPAVTGYRHEGGSGGGWGATVVDLSPKK
ncbi:MAG: Smr/MutS family protein [candidate division Zixibacteria bacterium]|nr:Smr/MutS family protein [candidate division Zixibacteria bacterium]